MAAAHHTVRSATGVTAAIPTLLQGGIDTPHPHPHTFRELVFA